MRPCATCNHPNRREIDRQLRSAVPNVTVSLWTRDHPPAIHRLAIGRHAARHLGVDQPRGPRPVSGDFLEAVVSTAHERMERGEIAPSVRDGIAAQSQLDARQKAQADRDMLAQIAAVLSGASSVVRISDGRGGLVTEAAWRELEPALLEAGNDAV